MTIKDMHYDFKMKLNKIDSQQYKNLSIPQIDWLLNESCEIFIKNIIEPRLSKKTGFEYNQRTIEDVRNLVEEDVDCVINNNTNTVILPENYWFWLRGNMYVSTANCSDIKLKVLVKQHDDDFENSRFDNSSVEWREMNVLFFKDGLKFNSIDNVIFNKFKMSYIRKLQYIHNAEDFGNNHRYILPDGVTILQNTQDCELLPHTHREIVDIAVYLATAQLSIPDLQTKLNKLKINELN